MLTEAMVTASHFLATSAHMQSTYISCQVAITCYCKPRV